MCFFSVNNIELYFLSQVGSILFVSIDGDKTSKTETRHWFLLVATQKISNIIRFHFISFQFYSPQPINILIILINTLLSSLTPPPHNTTTLFYDFLHWFTQNIIIFILSNVQLTKSNLVCFNQTMDISLQFSYKTVFPNRTGCFNLTPSSWCKPSTRLSCVNASSG